MPEVLVGPHLLLFWPILTLKGAHGVFTSYGNYSNITAASFLAEAGKQTPIFTRMSTVIGERGSVDSARDVHGFATRFYTDEGNFGKHLSGIEKKY